MVMAKLTLHDSGKPALANEQIACNSLQQTLKYPLFKPPFLRQHQNFINAVDTHGGARPVSLLNNDEFTASIRRYVAYRAFECDNLDLIAIHEGQFNHS